MSRATPLSCRRKSVYAVHSVENALDLLEAICDEGGEARISQLSQRLGMNKASVYRLLATFEGRGFVERSEDSLKYRLGLAACEMGQKLLSRLGMLRKARPSMERLARQCNESVYFVARRNDDLLMLDTVDSLQQVKITSLVGRRFPLAATVAGRLFATAAGPVENPKADHPLAPVPALPVAGDLEEICRGGVCIDEQGFGEGVTCVAVPLLDAKGEVAAVLAILGPAFRMSRERIEAELVPQLKDAGDVISAGLGYLGHYLRRKTI